MKRTLFAALTLATALGAVSARGADTTGAIANIDMKNHQLTLDDERNFDVQSNVSLSGVKVGDVVTLTTGDRAASDGNLTVTRIAPVKAP